MKTYQLWIACLFSLAAGAQGDSFPTETYPFSVVGAGPFTTTPISSTVVSQDQVLSFTSAMPFTLNTGSVEGFDDLTIPTFPDRFFNGTFSWSSSDGDSVFGTITVQTSVFTDPVDPAAGDFVGSEDFTGTFQFTGGTGQYLDATGGGTYSAHSDYAPPIVAGALFSGSTSVDGTGTVTLVVPEPGTCSLAAVAVGLGGFGLRQRKTKSAWCRRGAVNHWPALP